MNPPLSRRYFSLQALGLAQFFAVLASAKSKKLPVKYRNLAAARKFCSESFEKLTAAEQAKEWDAEGHAAKARDLLTQANIELKLAAEAVSKDTK